jgi:hypothetical protein
MRAVLVVALLAAACGSGERYVGPGTAEVTPRTAPQDKRTRRNDDEEAYVRRTEGGRLEVKLDECTFTTEPAVDGRAGIRPGTSCSTERVTSKARIVVQGGEVVLDEAAKTLTVTLEGDGRGSSLGAEVDVTYRYRFEGRRE